MVPEDIVADVEADSPLVDGKLPEDAPIAVDVVIGAG